MTGKAKIVTTAGTRRTLAALRNEVADLRNRLHVANDQIASLGRINAETQRRCDSRGKEIEYRRTLIDGLRRSNAKLREECGAYVKLANSLNGALHQVTSEHWGVRFDPLKPDSVIGVMPGEAMMATDERGNGASNKP
jgi:chromosome segregation ATPase